MKKIEHERILRETRERHQREIDALTEELDWLRAEYRAACEAYRETVDELNRVGKVA